MKRRDFPAGTLAGTGAVALSAAQMAAAQAAVEGTKPSTGARFKMKYAPHFNMFKNNAGNDPIDQLKFAADQGFTAWEDNGMMRKPVELQKQIGMEHGNSKPGKEGELAVIEAYRYCDSF